MTNSWIAIGLGVVVFVVLLLLWRASSKKNNNTTIAGKPFTGNVDPSDPPHAKNANVMTVDAFAGDQSNIPEGAFEAEVRMLIDYGNKVEAVRIVREKLGLDLKDAKDLVDRMESGAPVPMESALAPIDQAQDPDHEARRLAQSGRLIEAIKLVREQKGLDLKDAKAYVERL